MPNDSLPEIAFSDLNLSNAVLKALDRVGYETPTPIQAKTIPVMLTGQDIIGQAQTGTGKTAAFACPLLSKLDLKKVQPQVLVLTPTRELTIQVAETFQRYAYFLKDFHVLPIYGGQGYADQLRRLKRGAHVIVGTPGRVIDHMRRGALNLESLNCLVLDEADEMLRMGFIEDVEWILEQTPEKRQIALFSATMPKAIRDIAQKFLKEPEHITIKVRTATADTINQRYWMVSGVHKLDALTRILEGENFDGILIFVRTRSNTVELAEKLAARGYASEAINGDMAQQLRERTIDKFRQGKLNILVATDVAARGLDVDRISHVINYDIPYDSEAYIHRIGRTGRAGRSGEAILFVSPRERRMLQIIEKATRQRITLMELPSTEDINDKRIAKFKQQITDTLAVDDIGFFYQLVEQYRQEHNIPAIEIAAALAKLVQGDEPLLMSKKPIREHGVSEDDSRAPRGGARRKRTPSHPESGMERFRIEVGHSHGVKPGNIVGAIANEAGIDAEFIGRIDIFDDYSTVDLPEGLPRQLVKILQKTRVAGQSLQLAPFSDKGGYRHKKRTITQGKNRKERRSKMKKNPGDN
ncbi:DEAD/DEAH box helicase [candidate division KSB1 bacterium]|nr:DEAD/DEAH box helicase [candidate division KSB1 bacterium]